MSANCSMVGRIYPASATIDVSRETIRRFAVALGDDNPIYHDPQAARAAGHLDVIAPPTFLTTITHRFHDEGPLTDPDVGIVYARCVHGDQRFVHHRPIVAGDVLTAVVVIDEMRVVGGNELLGFATRVTDARGEPVADVWTSVISRGTASVEDAG